MFFDNANAQGAYNNKTSNNVSIRNYKKYIFILMKLYGITGV